MDFGASFHATYCKEELERFKLRFGKVCIADDKTLDIAGIKDVILKTFFRTSWTLKDVRWFGEAEESFLYNVSEDKETAETAARVAFGVVERLSQTFKPESTGIQSREHEDSCRGSKDVMGRFISISRGSIVCYEVLNGIPTLASELRVILVDSCGVSNKIKFAVTFPSNSQRKNETDYTVAPFNKRKSHEQELKMTLKKLSERQLQIQQCKVQEVQSSVTSSGDETSSGIVSDEEIDKQKLEAHSSYMAKIQEVSPDESSSTSQPLEQVQNHDENDVFANVRRHSEQPESINDTYVLEKDD
ncbi:hypothetical protein Tco_0578345 [Tanacetum coccineum]